MATAEGSTSHEPSAPPFMAAVKFEVLLLVPVAVATAYHLASSRPCWMSSSVCGRQAHDGSCAQGTSALRA
jgi:hypothetical protein